ncbi:hypothetical protein SAMN05660420_01682 [Desulfuromusa kysingii]|uniref:Uncharacterized protein n=1 Tax=Desulfuromusa kysingii TaxID=37625 RepID=A0A1H3ZUJ0_9BACT|nr:hypothetical protein [Desulfuromusa kysingii]SEA27383.1 hypothetical protein SAMN05660420_01682 [Desulfuromusa kysingii]
MSKEYRDRFSQAEQELEDKNAFICVSCNKKYHKDEAQRRQMTCCDRPLKELAKESFGP